MAWWATGEGDDVAGDWPADLLDGANERLAADAGLPQLLRAWQDALNREASQLLSSGGAGPFVLTAQSGAVRTEAAADPADPGLATIADQALRRFAQAYGDVVDRKPRLSELRHALHTSLRVAAQAGQLRDSPADIDAVSIEPIPDFAADPALQALAVIEALRRHLAPLLQALGQDRDTRLAAALRPQPGDASRAFVAEAAGAAEAAYTLLWSQTPPRVAPQAGKSGLRIDLAPAGMLADDNVLSRHFPVGYRSIAVRLVPNRVWARWSYLRADASSGIAYDGLVWLDNRWVWYPKPYRVLPS